MLDSGMVRIARLAVAATSVVLTACDPPTPTDEGPDRVPADIRPMVEQLVTEASAATWYTVRFSEGLSPPHLGFSGWLVGRRQRYAAHVSLATTADGEYEPFCMSGGPGGPGPLSGFWEEHDACSRLRIEEGEIRADVYFTERPHRLPDDRHELRYPTEVGPTGTVIYPRNPLITWRYEFAEDGSHMVEAAVQAEVLLETESGDDVVLDHRGTLLGVSNASGTLTRVELELAGLPGCPEPLDVVVDDDGETVTGSVRCGDTPLAAITHPEDAFRFDWLGSQG